MKSIEEGKRQMNIPVYLFTGFLGGGKTTFIQDTLTTPDFNGGERTLLLVCEEGEVGFDSTKFADPVYIETIKDVKDLTPENLERIERKHEIDRVMVEYNGMWMLQSLFDNMPRRWVIAQEMTFFDGSTFLMFNKNMRQLCFDKMKTAELVIFNRCEKGFDKMPFHKEARIANRRSQIVYEYGPYDVEPDNIQDPLPYDKTADKMVIEDDWYAEWYRDVNECEDDYDGKTVTLRGRVALADDLPEGMFAFGRHLMTCCVQDIQFAGLLCIYDKDSELKTGDWVMVKATIKIEYTDVYKEKGPVLYCRTVAPCDPAEPEVATF